MQLIIEHQTTNTASTRDWLLASKDMAISAYDPGAHVFQGRLATAPISEGTDSEPMFGTHLRETAKTVKEWFDRK